MTNKSIVIVREGEFALISPMVVTEEFAEMRDPVMTYRDRPITFKRARELGAPVEAMGVRAVKEQFAYSEEVWAHEAP